MSAIQDATIADLQRVNAALERQLDEYRAERDAALAREDALAEVLDITNRSSGDLAPVLNAILERAMRLCEATFGSFATFNGEFFNAVEHKNVPAELAEALQEPMPLTPGGHLMRIANGEAVVPIGDFLDTEAYRSGKRWAVALVEKGRARTAVWVALRREKALLGVLVIYRQEVRPFTEKQIALLRNFAAQAVIAMENARLLRELREALDEQTATAEVLRVINASPGSLEPVFAAMVDKAKRLTQSEFTSLMTYDGSVFHLFSGDQWEPETLFPEPGSALADLLDGAPFVHIEDVVDTDAYRARVPSRVRLVEEFGARTCLWIPMRKEDALLGLFVSNRQEIRPFSDRQIALLRNFADQAVIAMENARLLTEQREALEQQTATAEVLQVINASPGNLEPVFDVMLDKALYLCDAAFGALFLTDGEVVRAVGSRNIPTAFKNYLEREPPRIDAASLLGHSMRERVVLNVADLRETAPYRNGVPLSVAAVDLGGIRSICWVPLVHETAALGLFAIFRLEVRPFTEKQVELCRAFAVQAVIAMENARLLEELRHRTHELEEALEYQTAISEVLKVISRSVFELNTVLRAVIASAVNLCRAERAILYRHHDGRCHFEVGYNNQAEYEEHEREAPIAAGRESVVGRTMLERRVVQIVDAWEDPEYGPKDEARLNNVHSMLGVPLMRDGELIGVVALARTIVAPYTERQVELVTTFADQAVIAIENTRLLTEQKEALEQQTATADVLRVINASPGNLAPVFEAMLDKALRLCGAAFGCLWTYDGERMNAVALRGAPPAFAEFLTRAPHAVGPDNAHGRLLRGERVVHIADVGDDEAYRSGDPVRRALVALSGGRTLLAVPLRKDGAFLGDFVIYRTEVRPFSDKQIAFLQNFADQAVVAMENARLLNEVRQRQDELRITFENMGDGVALFDGSSHLVAWNHKFQEMFALPDALLEQHDTYERHLRFLAARGDFGAQADVEEQIRHLTTTTDRPEVYERTRPDGRVLEIRRNPVPSGGFVLIFSDITERKCNEAEIRAARDAAEAAYRELKAAQANLIQAEKMASLGQLTAGIAHEIKNPLNFVNNFADLSVELLDEMKTAVAPALPSLAPDRQSEINEALSLVTANLAKITEHGRRADGIVRSMLEHSRGGAGDRRRVDLNPLVEEALNLAYHGARAQDQSFNVTLQRDFAETIAPIEAVPQDLTRVLLNLFSNGFYAARQRQRETPDSDFEPTLKVITRDLGDAVEIRVRDNGTGIPAENRDKLFQPFFTTKPTGEGTGLGLSISYDIVTQQHGGSMTVDSQPGGYSEFTIRLPRTL